MLWIDVLFSKNKKAKKLANVSYHISAQQSKISDTDISIYQKEGEKKEMQGKLNQPWFSYASSKLDLYINNEVVIAGL